MKFETMRNANGTLHLFKSDQKPDRPKRLLCGQPIAGRFKNLQLSAQSFEGDKRCVCCLAALSRPRPIASRRQDHASWDRAVVLVAALPTPAPQRPTLRLLFGLNFQ